MKWWCTALNIPKINRSTNNPIKLNLRAAIGLNKHVIVVQIVPTATINLGLYLSESQPAGNVDIKPPMYIAENSSPCS